jgi:hypothetical protein
LNEEVKRDQRDHFSRGIDDLGPLPSDIPFCAKGIGHAQKSGLSLILLTPLAEPLYPSHRVSYSVYGSAAVRRDIMTKELLDGEIRNYG